MRAIKRLCRFDLNVFGIAKRPTQETFANPVAGLSHFGISSDGNWIVEMSALPESSPQGEFQQWALERSELSAALERTPEDGAERNRLLNRLYELERLIVETPSAKSSDVCMKADILLWYMEMEQADGLPAMRHIRAYLEQQC
jgi:hypothetical protein